MFNHAKFNVIKFNSKIVVVPVPVTFETTYDIGITRKSFWLEKTQGKYRSKILATPFVFTVKTTVMGETFALPLDAAGTYDFEVDWGDTTSDIITTWNQAEVTHTYMLDGTHTISITKNITGFRFNNAGDKLKIQDISNWGNLNLGNANNYFYGCSNLDVSATDTLDLTGTTVLNLAFHSCSSLTELDTSNWDTSSVASFAYTFYGCSGLTNLDTSGWDTSQVTTFYAMFQHCSGLTELDTSNWDTSQVTTFHATFYACSGLTELNTTNWNTSQVTSFSFAFYGCSGLTELNTSGWDTSQVTTFLATFRGCSGITEIDTTNWSIPLLTDATNMFYGVTLTTTNYNDLLTNFAAQSPSLQDNVPFHGGNSKYSAGAPAVARAALIAVHSWIITDGGLA